MLSGGCVVDYHGCDFFPERCAALPRPRPAASRLLPRPAPSRLPRDAARAAPPTSSADGSAWCWCCKQTTGCFTTASTSGGRPASPDPARLAGSARGGASLRRSPVAGRSAVRLSARGRGGAPLARARRGYSEKKVSENVECEIMQVVAEEARESYRWVVGRFRATPTLA